MLKLQKQKEKIFRFVMRFEHALDLLEIVMSITITLALIVCFIPLIRNFADMPCGRDSAANFHIFLEQVFTLVIGIEFVKMLIKHTPSSVLEVVLFAIARHMVIYETTPYQDFVSILSIAVIFAIRRFFYVHSFESKHDESVIQWLEPNVKDSASVKEKAQDAIKKFADRKDAVAAPEKEE
ncbi:MAG: hypothetical protein J6I56_02625 [Lachnospiraceae bacterium]|nr:hypothetical protein [Lachnospiraceae bacterium]